MDFISKYLENVRDIDEFGCPLIKELHKHFDFVSQSQQKLTIQ